MSSRRSVSSVPLMNSSLTVDVVPGPGSMPLNVSTVFSTMPSGRLNLAIGMPLVTSVMILFQSGAVVVVEKTGLTGAASELPIQTPTAIAGAFGLSGGATKPNASMSLLSSVVPVLYAAGRRVPFSRTCHTAQ